MSPRAIFVLVLTDCEQHPLVLRGRRSHCRGTDSDIGRNNSKA